jgi:hypothetical protein
VQNAWAARTQHRSSRCLNANIKEKQNMKRIRLLGIALIAVFSLGALVASSAMAEVSILPTPTAEKPAKFTGESTGTETLLESSAGTKVKCKKATSKGEFTSERAGTGKIDFEECESAGSKCNSPSDATGVILTSGSTQLVDVLPTGTLDLGLWIEAKEASGTGNLTFKCGFISVTVSGSVLGVVDNAAGALLKDLEKGKEFKVLWKATEGVKGEQQIKTCDLNKVFCEGKTFELKSNFGFGAELSAEIADAKLVFENEVEFHF